MIDYELDGKAYKIVKLSAKEQFHIARKLAPVFGSLQGAIGGDDPLASIGPLAEAISKLSDAEADYVVFGLLKAVSRKNPGGAWTPVSSGTVLMFDDINMPAMLKLAFQAGKENFGDFLAALPSQASDNGA